MSDSEPAVRWSAAEALCFVGAHSPIAIDALAEGLLDADPDVRYWAAEGLKFSGKLALRAKASAVKALKNTVKERRLEALEIAGLVGLSDEELSALVTPFLTDQQFGVRAKAANALAAQRVASAVVLNQMLADLQIQDEPEKCLAVGILGKLGESAKAAAPAIQKLLEKSGPSLCRQAAVAYFRITKDAKPSVAALLELLDKKSDAPGQAEGINGLADLGAAARDAGPKLMAFWADKTTPFFQQARAIEALATITPDANRPELQAALKDSRAELRLAAAFALARKGEDKAALAVLLAGLQSSSPESQLLALRYMELLGSSAQTATPAVEELFTHPDPPIRRQARATLAAIGKGKK
jgi:HEAT repeat protein